MNSAVVATACLGLWLLIQLGLLIVAWRTSSQPALATERLQRSQQWFAANSWWLLLGWLALSSLLAIVNMDSWYDLRETAYGQAWLIQLWVAGTVLLATAYVRWLLAPALRQKLTAAWQALPLVWTVQALLLGALLITSVQVANTPRPLQQVQRRDVIMDEYAFIPAQMTVNVEQPVRFIVSNQGDVIHDIVLRGTDYHSERLFVALFDHYDPTLESLCTVDADTLHVKLFPNTRVVMEFVPVQTGHFDMICTIARHRQRGMEGTFIVE